MIVLPWPHRDKCWDTFPHRLPSKEPNSHLCNLQRSWLWRYIGWGNSFISSRVAARLFIQQGNQSFYGLMRQTTFTRPCIRGPVKGRKVDAELGFFMKEFVKERWWECEWTESERWTSSLHKSVRTKTVRNTSADWHQLDLWFGQRDHPARTTLSSSCYYRKRTK